MKCKWHLCVNDLSGKQKSFCSIKCKNKYHVTSARRKIKEQLVKDCGGCCQKCGYSRCVSALQFHHVGDKNFGIGSSGNTRSYKETLEEAQKCVLLCANCHAEEHWDRP